MTWLDLLVALTIEHDPQLGLDAGLAGPAAAAAARDLWVASDVRHPHWGYLLGEDRGRRSRSEISQRQDAICTRALAALRAGDYRARGVNTRTGQVEDVPPEVLAVAELGIVDEDLRIGTDYRIVGLRFALAAAAAARSMSPPAGEPNPAPAAGDPPPAIPPAPRPTGPGAAAETTAQVEPPTPQQFVAGYIAERIAAGLDYSGRGARAAAEERGLHLMPGYGRAALNALVQRARQQAGRPPNLGGAGSRG